MTKIVERAIIFGIIILLSAGAVAGVCKKQLSRAELTTHMAKDKRQSYWKISGHTPKHKTEPIVIEFEEKKKTINAHNIEKESLKEVLRELGVFE